MRRLGLNLVPLDSRASASARSPAAISSSSAFDRYSSSGGGAFFSGGGGGGATYGTALITFFCCLGRGHSRCVCRGVQMDAWADIADWRVSRNKIGSLETTS